MERVCQTETLNPVITTEKPVRNLVAPPAGRLETHLLSCDHNAVPHSYSHGGKLSFGLFRESRRTPSWRRERQRRGGAWRLGPPSQQGPELLGRCGGVGHIQGHVQGIRNHVGGAKPLLVLSNKASTVSRRLLRWKYLHKKSLLFVGVKK